MPSSFNPRRWPRRLQLGVPETAGGTIPQSPPLKLGNIVGRAVTRLVGAILLEQSDEWATQRRYMSLETLAPVSDAPTVGLPAVAGRPRLSPAQEPQPLLHQRQGHDQRLPQRPFRSQQSTQDSSPKRRRVGAQVRGPGAPGSAPAVERSKPRKPPFGAARAGLFEASLIANAPQIGASSKECRLKTHESQIFPFDSPRHDG